MNKRLCEICHNQQKREINICAECLKDEMLSIIPESCPICCAPIIKGLESICTNCSEFESQGKNYIDDIIPITYGINRTFFSYIVRGHKYYNNNDYFVPLASVLFKFLLSNSKKIIQKFGNFDYFIYIPSYKDQRKHNKNLIHSVKFEKFKIVDMLIEPKEHPRKQGMEKADRKVEEDRYIIADGYSVNRKNILLYDDVCTSGSTIRSAAYPLKHNGANMVIGIVLFKQVYAEFRDNIVNFSRNHPFNYNEWKYDIIQ